MSSAAVPPPVTVRRIPNPSEPVPVVATPTLALLVGGLAGWILATVLYLTGTLPWWLTIPANAVTGYLLFTVAHDAGHRSASRVRWLNNTMGRLSTPLFVSRRSFSMSNKP